MTDDDDRAPLRESETRPEIHVERVRERRSSTTRLDLVSIAIDEIDAIEGVELDGPAARMEMTAILKTFSRRMYDLGKEWGLTEMRRRDVEVADLVANLDRERSRLEELRFTALKFIRGEIDQTTLMKEIFR